MEEAPAAEAPLCEGGTMTLTEGTTVGEFAETAGVSPNDIIKRLMLLGEPLTVNQPLSTSSSRCSLRTWASSAR